MKDEKFNQFLDKNFAQKILADNTRAFRKMYSFRVLKLLSIKLLKFNKIDPGHKKLSFVWKIKFKKDHQVTTRKFLGEIYNQQERARKNYHIPKKLEVISTAKVDFFNITRPVWWLKSYHLTLRELVGGAPLTDLIRTKYSLKKIEWVIKKIAQALAGLHQISPRSFGPLKLDPPESTFVKDFLKKLPAKYQQLKNINTLLKIEKEKYRLKTLKPTVLTHGDFHAGNIILGKNKIYLIDFDWVKLYNPASDLGRFCLCLNHLITPKFGPEAARRVERIFISHYKKRMPYKFSKSFAHYIFFFKINLLKDILIAEIHSHLEGQKPTLQKIQKSLGSIHNLYNYYLGLVSSSQHKAT